MIIFYDGRDYPFDFDDTTLQQAMKIEKFMGCSFDDWGKKLQEGALNARQALGWIVLYGGDLNVQIEDVDFKMAAFGRAIAAAFEAEEAKTREPEPVPTGAVASNGHGPEAALSPVSSPPSSDEISR